MLFIPNRLPFVRTAIVRGRLHIFGVLVPGAPCHLLLLPAQKGDLSEKAAVFW